jgi:hypothetical protein
MLGAVLVRIHILGVCQSVGTQERRESINETKPVTLARFTQQMVELGMNPRALREVSEFEAEKSLEQFLRRSRSLTLRKVLVQISPVQRRIRQYRREHRGQEHVRSLPRTNSLVAKPMYDSTVAAQNARYSSSFSARSPFRARWS